MTTPRDLVESFYADVWNRRDVDAARRILATDFRFRGSLGPEKRGVDGFVTYLDAVHTALGGFTCIIEDLVETPDRAAARMLFRGVHQAELFGVPATGKKIEWSGAAFFTVRQEQLAELWVLGDVDPVKRQLGPAATSDF
ncbi:ester cyclase [Hoeflea sp. CAU 1731]